MTNSRSPSLLAFENNRYVYHGIIHPLQVILRKDTNNENLDQENINIIEEKTKQAFKKLFSYYKRHVSLHADIGLPIFWNEKWEELFHEFRSKFVSEYKANQFDNVGDATNYVDTVLTQPNFDRIQKLREIGYIFKSTDIEDRNVELFEIYKENGKNKVLNRNDDPDHLVSTAYYAAMASLTKNKSFEIDDRFFLIFDQQEIDHTLKSLGLNDVSEVTSIAVNIANGDYQNVLISRSSRPYLANAEYEWVVMDNMVIPEDERKYTTIDAAESELSNKNAPGM